MAGPPGPAVPVSVSNVALQNAIHQQGLVLQQMQQDQQRAEWKGRIVVAGVAMLFLYLLVPGLVWPTLVYIAVAMNISAPPTPVEPIPLEPTPKNGSAHDALWKKYAYRNKLIELHTKDRVDECTVSRDSYVEETIRMMAELSAGLAQNAGDYENGTDVEEGKRLRELESAISQRAEHSVRMDARMYQLESMANDNGVMVEWTMKPDFEFERMLYAHDMCQDKNECFCDILLAPQKDLDAVLKQNKKDIIAAEKKKKKEM